MCTKNDAVNEEARKINEPPHILYLFARPSDS